MKNSKKIVGAVGLAIIIGMAVQCFGESESINPVRIATRQLNVYGTNPLQIHSTNVTSTAAELNIMDGVTVTASQLNAAGGGSTATITPTLVTNLNLVVRGTNVSASGSFQVGQSHTGTYTVAMGPILLSQPPGVVDSNAASLWLAVQKLGSTNWYWVSGFQGSAP